MSLIIMDEVFEFLNQKMETSENYIVLMAIEFNKDGYPISQSAKITANPACAAAGLHMITKMIQEQYEKLDEKLDERLEIASDVSEKLQKLIEGLGFEGAEDPRFKEFLNNSDKGRELKELLKKLKNQFGK